MEKASKYAHRFPGRVMLHRLGTIRIKPRAVFDVFIKSRPSQRMRRAVRRTAELSASFDIQSLVL